MAEPNSVVSGDTAKLVGQTMSLRNSPGQQTRSGDSAGWGRGIKPSQPRPLRRESIKIRSLNFRRRVVASKIAVPEIVSGNNENIRRRHSVTTAITPK